MSFNEVFGQRWFCSGVNDKKIITKIMHLLASNKPEDTLQTLQCIYTV